MLLVDKINKVKERKMNKEQATGNIIIDTSYWTEPVKEVIRTQLAVTNEMYQLDLIFTEPSVNRYKSVLISTWTGDTLRMALSPGSSLTIIRRLEDNWAIDINFKLVGGVSGMKVKNPMPIYIVPLITKKILYIDVYKYIKGITSPLYYAETQFKRNEDITANRYIEKNSNKINYNIATLRETITGENDRDIICLLYELFNI